MKYKFRNPDCIIVRLGEIALKSEQVKNKWMKILLENIDCALKKIEYRIEINPNRIFIYTDKIYDAINQLKRVFGITSVSPAWVCFAGLDEMKILAVEVAKFVGLNKNKKFAIRVRTAGRHKFSSRIIAEEVGAAVKKITNSPVDLENPDIEINIECRSRKAYIFTEKYECAGGLPLGTAGKVCVVMNNKKTMIEAAWLLARKGCELILIFEKDNKNFEDSLKILNKWYYGREIKYYFYDKLKFLEEINSIAEKENALAIVFPDNFQKITLKDIEKINIENKNIKFPILRPIIFMRKNELKKLKNKIFLPLKNE
ncbi:MAG: THUMP domain-containing protein [Candidatus Aenigmatarchaeota archaeon]|nr:hypothetical protein [Candidatus Aenigmarchaeota archaeon]